MAREKTILEHYDNDLKRYEDMLKKHNDEYQHYQENGNVNKDFLEELFRYHKDIIVSNIRLIEHNMSYYQYYVSKK
jgi:hypothetical protein